MTELLASRAQQAEDKHRQQQLLKFQQDDMIRDQLLYAQRAEEREVGKRGGVLCFCVCLDLCCIVLLEFCDCFVWFICFLVLLFMCENLCDFVQIHSIFSSK
jgi:hypothetical protein